MWLLNEDHHVVWFSTAAAVAAAVTPPTAGELISHRDPGSAQAQELLRRKKVGKKLTRKQFAVTQSRFQFEADLFNFDCRRDLFRFFPAVSHCERCHVCFPPAVVVGSRHVHAGGRGNARWAVRAR